MNDPRCIEISKRVSGGTKIHVAHCRCETVSEVPVIKPESIQWNNEEKKYEYVPGKTVIDDSALVDRAFKVLLLNELSSLNSNLKDISTQLSNLQSIESKMS